MPAPAYRLTIEIADALHKAAEDADRTATAHLGRIVRERLMQDDFLPRPAAPQANTPEPPPVAQPVPTVMTPVVSDAAVGRPIVTRIQATKARMTHYFTGKACKNGHIALRYTNSGVCLGCLNTNRKRASA